jgi:hypothetical protein
MNSVTSQQEIVNLRETVEAQKRVINAQREKLHWWEEIHKNSHIPVNMRLAIIAVKKLQEFAQPDEDGFIYAHLPTLAGFVGSSPSSMSRGLIGVADHTDVLERRLDPIPGEPHKSTVHLKVSDLIDHASDIKPTKGEIARHGGKRIKRCENPQCRSTNLIEESVVVCRECGHRHEMKRRDVNADAIENIINDDWNIDVDSYMSEPDPLQDETTPEEPDPEPDPLQLASNLANTLPVHRDAISEVPVSSCNGNGIPEELKALDQWCCQRAKIPFDAKIVSSMRMGSMKASCSDEATWATFERAAATLELSQKWAIPYDGIGFMAKEENGFVFTDYDPDRATNTLPNPEQVYRRVQLTDSYHEFSSSGVGIRGIAKGTIPRNIKQPGLEMYSHAKFMVLTGNHLPGTPLTVEPRQEQLTALFNEIAPPVVERRASKHVFAPCGLSEQQVLAKCRDGKNSARFERLWEGDASDYCHHDGKPDHSRADLALCEELGYRADGDREMVDRLFRQSGLMRPKWERADYREWTLNRALGLQIAS